MWSIESNAEDSSAKKENELDHHQSIDQINNDSSNEERVMAGKMKLEVRLNTNKEKNKMICSSSR